MVFILEKIKFIVDKVFFAFRFLHCKIYLIFNLLILIIVWISSYLLYKNINGDLIVLGYNVDFGVTMVGDAIRIFDNAIFYSMFFIINIILLIIFSRHRDFLFISHLINIVSLMVGLFFAMSIASIYLINYL